LLETLQRFASKKALKKDGDGEAHRRHLDYFTRMAEEAYLDQFESSAHWLPKLKLDYGNLISALNWADQNHPEGFRILAAYLPWFWVFNSLILTGKQYLEKAYSHNSEGLEVEARVLFGLGYLTYYFQDPEKVIKLLNKSLALWQKYDNPFEEAVVTGILSMTYQQIKDYKLSFKYSTRSLDLAREVGKPGLINNALIYLGIAMVHSRQFTDAIPYLEELLASSIASNHTLGISAAHHLLSDCALGLKDFPGAEKTYGMGIQSALKHGILFNAYADLQGLAFALSGQCRWAKSLRLNAIAVHMFKATGIEIYGIWPLWDEFTDTYIGRARKAVGEEMAKQYEKEGIAMGFDGAVEYAMDFTVD
jgi:tetratricopeptide (TPR) repeat protein